MATKIDSGLIVHGNVTVKHQLDNVQKKQEEMVSVKDRGAAGDGVTDDTAKIENTWTSEDFAHFPGGTYLSTNATLENGNLSFGSGSLTTETQDSSIVVVADTGDINALVPNVKFIGMKYGPMPDATSDNWAALNFNTTKGAVAALLDFKNVWTAVRSSYYLGGAVSVDNLVIGCYVEDAANMGFELIQSKYNRIIGNAVHNNGVPAGLHGVRFSGNGIGNILVGNSLRDRGSSGISLQVGNTHGIAVGNYIEKSGQSGVEVDSASNWEGSHFLGPMIVKDSSLDGFDLDYISGCYVQGLVDTTGSTGIRTSGTPSQGKHVIDALIKRAGNTALNLRSDKNLVKVLADSTTSGTPIAVSGNNNFVIVLVADSSVTNSVTVAGNNNTVIIQEAGTGTVGLRVDGNGNAIYGRTNGNVLVVGDNNLFDVYVGSNVTINAGADNNRFSGYIAGVLQNNGTGNYFNGLYGGATRASTTAATDSVGRVAVTHGCKKTPVSVRGTYRGDNPYIVTLISVSSTTAVFKVWDSAGLAVSSTSVTIDWEAVI